MISYCFTNYSPIILGRYKQFIEKNLAFVEANLLSLYTEYACLDKNMPRPILTVLGANYTQNESNIDMVAKAADIILIPQLLRDFLAIHDDIIDEDLIKFNHNTLPFSLSQLNERSATMTKRGKDFAILWGDLILPLVYKIAAECDCDEHSRSMIIQLINQVLIDTNCGQIEELRLEAVQLQNISEGDILKLYRQKAANYCYAFPFLIGLAYAASPIELINDAREILLTIGSCSQIVNDIEGVFNEQFGEERDTISDLMNMRRTYLVVKLANTCNDTKIKKLLNKTRLTNDECMLLKEAMYGFNILNEVRSDVERICALTKQQIEALPIGNVCKEYFNDLINERVLSNLSRVNK